MVRVDGGRQLEKLVETAEDGNFKFTAFYEPDRESIGIPTAYQYGGVHYANEEDGPWLTAVAFAPNWYAQYVLLADLPLALDHKAVMSKVGLSDGYIAVRTDLHREYLERSGTLTRLESANAKTRRRYFKDLSRKRGY